LAAFQPNKVSKEQSAADNGGFRLQNTETKPFASVSVARIFEPDTKVAVNRYFSRDFCQSSNTLGNLKDRLAEPPTLSAAVRATIRDREGNAEKQSADVRRRGFIRVPGNYLPS
jgi:hypothetical protein